jgi:S1-C subfamily serine protease
MLNEYRLMASRSTALCLFSLVSIFSLRAETAIAQELDARTTDRCVRAAVRIVVADANGNPAASGSGSMIDSRGYVLTNFHVVGNVSVQHGPPGTLLVPANRYEIAIATSAREAVTPRYIARVVRADQRLDLALLRIVATTDGRALPRNTRFTAIELASTAQLRPGSRVWAFGFPMNVRTINVTGGQVTGFQMNADDAVAWLRSDAEFNPGNSGGMLVDTRGRLVAVPTAVVHGRSTLEPIELARPVERVPASWLRDLRRGIDDVRIDGVSELVDGSVVTSAAVGDVGGIGESEIHFYRIGRALRPAHVTLSGGTPELVLADPAGRIVRRGTTSMEIRETDPPDLLLAVVTPNPAESPLRYEVRAAMAAPMARVVATAPRLGTDPGTSAPVVALPPTRPMAAAVAAPGTASIRGSILDATTGQPMANVLVIVGRPDSDLARGIGLLVAGRVDEASFLATLIGVTRTDAAGQYAIAGLPMNTRYPGAAVAPGRPPVMLSIAVGAEGSVIGMNPISITGAR